jgi:hypothetical protein
MITINKITPPSVLLYNPQGLFMGVVNEYEFHDARVQIKQCEANGYYVEYNGLRIDIDKDGRVGVWPDGMFDQITNSLINLL